MNLLLGWPNFRDYVSFREGILFCMMLVEYDTTYILYINKYNPRDPITETENGNGI